jgi:hypothetical protein
MAEINIMSDDSRDSVNRDGLARRNAIEPAEASGWTPGLSVVLAGVLAIVVCVANFALGEVTAGIAAAIVGMLAFGAGLDWIAMDRRRIRQAEREWFASHPARCPGPSCG